MVQLEPVDEESDDIVRTDSSTGRVDEDIRDVSLLLPRVGLVPSAKGLSNKPEVFIALNSLLDCRPEGLKALLDLR